ncbi:MAG: lactate racemase domain-containing protein [bacterium]
MKNISIPFKAWYGDEQFILEFPDNWEIQEYNMVDAPPIPINEIEKAFYNPIGSKRISELVRGKTTAAIAVEDMTRPSPLEDILQLILKELKIGGIEDKNIKIIISTGGHRPLLQDDLIKKLGREIVKRCDIYNHNPFENLSTLHGIRINRFFLEAEFKIVVGSVIPHPFAGFSGGAKIVSPGLTGIEWLVRSHKSVLMGLKGSIGVVEGNKFRAELEQIAKNIGVDIGINIVPNSKRQIAKVVAGDIVEAHREAVRFAREIYMTKIPHQADVVILNAYPKDTELLQSENAFDFYRSANDSIIKQNGVVILISACSLGRGYHALFEPGMQLYRLPGKKRFLGDKRLFFFSPYINHLDFCKVFWSDYFFFDNWQKLITELKKIYPDNCQIAIFPYSSIQLAQNEG